MKGPQPISTESISTNLLSESPYKIYEKKEKNKSLTAEKMISMTDKI